jgi:hypothetical protein
MKERTAHERHLYSKVGGFWAALLHNFHRWGRWPNINEIFFGDEQQVRILLTPLERDAADLLWRQSDPRLRLEESGDEWIMPGSQLEPLLRRFRREESAQASRETSEPSKRERQP